MKKILVILTLGTFMTVNAQQTISSLIENATKIKGRLSASQYQIDIEQKKKISSILELDVYRYHYLTYQYNSDLKRKVFEDSDEYKSKRADIEKYRADLLTKTYYLDFEPSYYERNNLIKYDLQSKTFRVSNSIYKKNDYNKTGFVQFDEFIIKTPKGISVKRNTKNIGGVDFIEQDIHFKILDEATALKIEEGSSNLRMLFIFNFSGTANYQGKDILGNPDEKIAPITTLAKVVIYNSQDKEIYHIFE